MKADLNLIPKKEAVISKQTIFIGVLLAAVIFLVVGYFFVYIPEAEKKSILNEMKDKQTEIDSYDGLDEQDAQLTKEITALKKLINAIDELKIKNIKITDRIADIGEIIPVEVMIDSISYSDGFMNITGTAPDMIQVAQFMVNLRKMDYVLNVSSSGLNYVENNTTLLGVEDEEDNEENEDNEDKSKYKFNLAVVYMPDQREILDPATEEGGGE